MQTQYLPYKEELPKRIMAVEKGVDEGTITKKELSDNQKYVDNILPNLTEGSIEYYRAVELQALLSSASNDEANVQAAMNILSNANTYPVSRAAREWMTDNGVPFSTFAFDQMKYMFWMPWIFALIGVWLPFVIIDNIHHGLIQNALRGISAIWTLIVCNAFAKQGGMFKYYAVPLFLGALGLFILSFNISHGLQAFIDLALIFLFLTTPNYVRRAIQDEMTKLTDGKG